MKDLENNEIETTPESDGSEYEPSPEAQEQNTQELEITPDPENDEETDELTTSTEDLHSPENEQETNDIKPLPENEEETDEIKPSPENEEETDEIKPSPEDEEETDEIKPSPEDEEINNAATSSQDELNTDQLDDFFDEDDLDGPSDDFNPDREYTDEDLKLLEEEDPGYINGDVLDYDHPDYINDGIHRIKWGADSADVPHQETLDPGTRLSRVGDEYGRYLGDENVAYDDRQLPVYEGKQPIHNYEVLKPLDVEQSTIAQQDWGPEMKNPDAQQYKTDKSIADLLDQGYLKEIPTEGVDGITAEQGRGMNNFANLDDPVTTDTATSLPEIFNDLPEDKQQKQLDALNKMSPDERKIYLDSLAKEPAITDAVKEITTQNGGSLEGLDYRVKTPTSTYEKMYGRDDQTPIGEMRDIVRYTEIFPKDSLAEGTNASLQAFENKGYTVDRVSNTWDKENATYRGINANLTSPDGQPFEVQFHTPESFELKNGELHSLYEEQRTLPEDHPRAIELEDRMVDLSSKLERPANIDEVKNR